MKNVGKLAKQNSTLGMLQKQNSYFSRTETPPSSSGGVGTNRNIPSYMKVPDSEELLGSEILMKYSALQEATPAHKAAAAKEGIVSAIAFSLKSYKERLQFLVTEGVNTSLAQRIQPLVGEFA